MYLVDIRSGCFGLLPRGSATGPTTTSAPLGRTGFCHLCLSNCVDLCFYTWGPLWNISHEYGDLKDRGIDLGYEQVLRLEEEETGENGSTLCLIGKVLSDKPFNAFGLLEAMRKAMNPSRGFTAKEIGKNLFSFQFWSRADLLGILNREPWLFDKHVILLKELGGGEQPSTVTFTTSTFWVRIYDLPMAARSVKSITQC
ncbi:hypothetical protein ACS0TY_020610 [Phlomoides rotata]